MSETSNIDLLLDSALEHVIFDGWSPQTMKAAANDAGITDDQARVICPRGVLDLAAAYHRRADQIIALTDNMQDMRYSQKVSELIWQRIEAVDKEVVRRGMAFFALPQNASEGAALIWGTADAIWNALGDTSDDLNWYSKRTILAAVFSSSVLFWLGDTSDGNKETRAYISRRIEDVMRFENAKRKARETPLLGPLAQALDRFAASIPAPKSTRAEGYPGWTRKATE